MTSLEQVSDRNNRIRLSGEKALEHLVLPFLPGTCPAWMGDHFSSGQQQMSSNIDPYNYTYSNSTT